MGQAAKKYDDIRFQVYKELNESVRNLFQTGGRWQKKAEKVMAVIGSISEWNADVKNALYPLQGLKETNKGESRIDSCVKYDLGDGVRLITVQENGICALLFVGKHDECEKWIKRNKRFKLSVDENKRLTPNFKSLSIVDDDKKRRTESDFSEGKLWQKLSERYFQEIFNDLPSLVVRGLKGLESTFSDDELQEYLEVINTTDAVKANALLDIFMELREGDTKQAKRRIDLYRNRQVLIEELEEDDLTQIKPGEEFFDFEDFDSTDLLNVLNSSGFKEWMLFLHPEQNKIVKEDYNGPAKLAGVSGSGKTAIIVKRAIRLAKKYTNEQILIVTLNKALANLIKELVYTACPNDGIRAQIEIKSFWKLCKDELKEFEKDIEKRFNEFTWKHGETAEEIWDEYYFCEKNNDDADEFYPVHQSLLSRNVNPRLYIKQEFDWIRSAFAPSEREEKYLEIDREGRSEPLTADYRKLMLQGLKGWEDKMDAIGVSDYTGLAARLHKYKDKLEGKYRSILVDELQDFGTMELALLRKLVNENENDMFLCGDIAQQVHTKHHKITHAGINIIGRSHKIKQNYRNSREILKAAYEVLKTNVNLDEVNTDDFEIIEPDFANFSTPKPFLIQAASLEAELGHALSYITEYLKVGNKACVAIAGLSLHQVKQIGEQVDIDVLDNLTKIDSSDIFLSDLDQTKGFEFDMMFVLNCKEGVIPDKSLPEAEWHRDICKLYVAMTRAKKELFVSYHHKPSSLFDDIKENFISDDWASHSTIIENYENVSISKKNKYSYDKKRDSLNLTGREFLYTDYSIGLPIEVQDKLLKLVQGKNASTDGKTTQWPSVYELFRERDAPNLSTLMGRTAYQKFRDHINKKV